ncbi:hypothetical protein O9K51_01308 [Purpureocillium lavendulum]|uniref:Uncharacterized protein n=1 Tax=Purpureocillium lavendulum TaxID=1247861 RepID=A0AB34G8M2_9HYPO|nr:hypothetical protein O9K51_01308 [Purpureocillium lavendulum]
MKHILNIVALLAFGASALPKGLVSRNGLDGDLAYSKPVSPDKREPRVSFGDYSNYRGTGSENMKRSSLDGEVAYRNLASAEKRSGADGDGTLDLAYAGPGKRSPLKSFGNYANYKDESSKKRSGLDGDLAYSKPISPEKRSGLDGDLAYSKPISPEKRAGLASDLAN